MNQEIKQLELKQLGKEKSKINYTLMTIRTKGIDLVMNYKGSIPPSLHQNKNLFNPLVKPSNF
jgi:hypothetical protein